jgi:thiol-disulfide isomerase/thioredoxin
LTTTAGLPIEGMLPDLDGATAWLNSEPLSSGALRGRVVVVQFCTFSCVNWLRTSPYLAAWAAKYRDAGLVVVGVHSPEFPFEHDVAKVRVALADLGIGYPIAIDNGFTVWRAFGNSYWPALYFVDVLGQLRHHHFGEEDYERSEEVIQRLLADAGRTVVPSGIVRPVAGGVALAADWTTVQSPEGYVGFGRAAGFVSPGGFRPDRPKGYELPSRLPLNRWALSGRWVVNAQAATLDEPDGRIVHRFRARDVNLVMGSRTPRVPVRFQVRIDGAAPGPSHGLDVDENGEGLLDQERLYQLIRQDARVIERTVEIAFLDAGVQAYVFTFG